MAKKTVSGSRESITKKGIEGLSKDIRELSNLIRSVVDAVKVLADCAAAEEARKKQKEEDERSNVW